MSVDGYDFWLKDGCGGRIVLFDGDKMLKARRTDQERKGGSGFGVSLHNVSFTLNTIDRHGIGVFK